MDNKEPTNSNFNSERQFCYDMNKILIDLILPKLHDMIEYSFDTHDSQGLQELMQLLNKYHY